MPCLLIIGGLPIAQYSIFVVHDDSFAKLTSIMASSTSEKTTLTVTRDAGGIPLRPLTSYTFKVLALQANVVCDTLTEDGLESDAVVATTGIAAIPAPPSRAALLLLSGCTALIAVVPPDDFRGADVTGMTIGVFLPTGILFESFAVSLYPSEITVRNLLAHTSYSVKASLSTTVGDSGFGETLTFTTEDPSLPGKLNLLEIENVGSSSVLVSWEGPQNTGGGAVSGNVLRCIRLLYSNSTMTVVSCCL